MTKNKSRKRKPPQNICSSCEVEFKNDSELLRHMKTTPQCQSKILHCIACHKEYTSNEKLHGHLGHYSSKNCLALHNEYNKNSHRSSVMNILPQTSEQFPVHQNSPNYSAQERIGRNYLIGVSKDFLSGEIGLEEFSQKHVQNTLNQALEACNPCPEKEEQMPLPPPCDPHSSSEKNPIPSSSDIGESMGRDIDSSPTVSAPYSEFGYISDEDQDPSDEMDEDDEYRHEEYDEDENGEMSLCRPTNPHMAEPTVTPITNPHMAEPTITPIDAPPVQPRRRFQEFNISSCDLLNRQKNLKDIRTNLRVDKNTIACLKLQNILHQANCPMSVYDKVMEWTQTYKDDLYSVIPNPSHSQLVELSAKKLFGQVGDSHKVLGMFPSTQHIKLPTKREVDVTTFSFRKMVCHMLSDVDLMKWDNLIFQKLGDNRFHVETNSDQDLGEINTGKWFQKTFEALIEQNPIGPDGRRRILCPIIFYIDGLSLDAYGKLTLEPLTFTLGIFKDQLRNLAKAWRTLGFMEDLDSLYGANLQSSLDKANDYHAILSCILEEFKQVQELNCPIPFDLMIDGELHSVDLIFEVAYVIGDCKGLDMLAGRKASHSTAGLTRLCDCKMSDGDNADVICKLLKYDDLKEMSEKRLEEIAFRKLSPCNAFEGISWGANKRGIIGATPADALHTILKDGPVGSAIKSIRTEMPKQGLHEMDKTAAKIAVTCSRQSDKHFPSINPFRNGLSKVNKLTADEIYAKTFMYFLVFNHKPFSNYLIDRKFRTGPKETSKKKQWSTTEYRKAHRGLEIVLSFYQWVMKDTHTKSDFEGGRDSVANKTCRKFLAEFLEVLPLHKGFGHRRPKIHFQLHWAFWIIMFGCAKNFDSARCECIAGENVKKHSQKTQKRANSLNLQTATRIAEETIFSDLRKLANIQTEDVDLDETPNVVPDEDSFEDSDCTHSTGIKGGSRFTITFERDTNKGTLTWSRPNTPGHFNKLIVATISQRLHNFASQGFGSNGVVAKLISIDGFTELKKGLDDDSKKLTTFRSIPSFRDGRPWKDWANFKWDIDGDNLDLEGRIEMFLDYSSIKIDTYSDDVAIDGDPQVNWEERYIRSVPISEIETKAGYTGKYVCVTTSVDENEANVRVRPCMRSNISTLKKCKEQLCYVSTEHLFEEAYVIPDSYYEAPSILPHEIMVYHPIKTWANSLFDSDTTPPTDDDNSTTMEANI